MQRMEKLYYVIEGEKNRMDNLSKPGTYFSVDQCNSPEFKKCYTDYALRAHKSRRGGTFHIDKNIGILRTDMMAVVLEYNIPAENQEAINTCIQNSFNSDTVKTNKGFGYQSTIIPMKDLLSPDNFLGYHVHKSNQPEMEFFSREDLLKIDTEESYLNNNRWCGLFSFVNRCWNNNTESLDEDNANKFHR